MKMNVLSLFDGMSCGQIALNRAGVDYGNYYASEIDPFAIKVSQHNYPNTQQLGNVLNVKSQDLPKIDLLIGGSPCTGFSKAGKQLNFEDPHSKLFFQFVRILNETKPKHFLLENVKMKKEWQDVISSYLGVEPILINSNLVSAQNRSRLYWTNINIDNALLDKGILIKDITEDGGNIILEDFYKNREIRIYDKKCPTLRSERNGLKVVKNITLSSILETNVNDKEFLLTEESIVNNDIGKFRDNKIAKQVMFTERRTEEAKAIRREYQSKYGKDYCPRRGKELVPRTDDKANCLTTALTKEHIILDENYVFRKLTPLECERLQTVPDNYTNVSGVSNTQRYKMLGNGWTIDVIAYLLSNIQF